MSNTHISSVGSTSWEAKEYIKILRIQDSQLTLLTHGNWSPQGKLAHLCIFTWIQDSPLCCTIFVFFFLLSINQTHRVKSHHSRDFYCHEYFLDPYAPLQLDKKALWEILKMPKRPQNLTFWLNSLSQNKDLCSLTVFIWQFLHFNLLFAEMYILQMTWNGK